MKRLDVAILGAGVAGLTAAWHLRDLDIEVFEADDYAGGRTKSISFANGLWGNFGAQYVSPDKAKVVELADAVGAELVPIEEPGQELFSLDRLDGEARAQVEATIARIEAEQAQLRPDTAPELDDVRFSDWLGPLSPQAAAWFELWAEVLIGPSVDTSLYGALLLWGDQRTEAFAPLPVRRHNRGDCVFRHGTNQLAIGLARAIGGRVSLKARVCGVAADGDGYEIALVDDTGRRTIRARSVISALPAPVAREVLELPGWKRDALGAVRYSRLLGTPIGVAPAGETVANYRLTSSRGGAVYDSTGFALRTPGDIDAQGCCFHAWLVDAHARPVWDDPPDTIQTGVLKAFLGRFPEFAERIFYVGFQKWRLALPRYVPGRQKLLPSLTAPVGAVHFCGDYTLASNLDGAARSGERAAREVRERLGLVPEPG
jgi:monoamine oxidase